MMNKIDFAYLVDFRSIHEDLNLLADSLSAILFFSKANWRSLWKWIFQLLNTEDQGEMTVIQNSLMNLFRRDPQGAVMGIFSQVLNTALDYIGVTHKFTNLIFILGFIYGFLQFYKCFFAELFMSHSLWGTLYLWTYFTKINFE